MLREITYHFGRKIFSCLLTGIISLFSFHSFAQTNISGTVNIYTPVTAIGCTYVDVVSSSGFAPGDRVVLIQMKGAKIDSTNTSAFGTVANYGNCGNYEFATIASITGNTIYFVNTVLNSYTISGHVQLIRVGVYTNANIAATLSCSPWLGSTGGVLVLEVSGTLSFASNINVSGMGFRGGIACTNPNGNCGAGYPDYFYPVSSGNGAEKGEGIMDISVNKNGGMGALGNGGGGGNKHNSGGGGGSNFSAGGKGGNETSSCPGAAVGGCGGVALNYGLNKIFLGGGGGCSDNNNGVGTFGTSGGGIVIIRAGTISGNGFFVFANGIDVGVFPNAIGDGAGGGGAAGTILLSTSSFVGTLNCLTRGGKGGDQNTSFAACFGPGGGGGTGVCYFSLPAVPGNVNVTTIPGVAGLDVNGTSPCNGSSYGAAPGASAVGIMNNLVLPESNSPPISLALQSQTNILCHGGLTGTATTNPGGGNLPYTYVWTPSGGTNATATGLGAGNYTCTVTDASGCTDTAQVTITEPPAITGNSASTPTTCGNGSDGTATAAASGGTGTLNYLWAPSGGTNANATGLTAGNYTCTVTDANGCTLNITVTVSQPPPITATANFVNTSCGNNNGSATVNASGGTGTLNYSWAPSGGTNSTATGLPSGTYTVYITDVPGCTFTDTITIAPSTNPSLTLQSQVNVLCNGASTGSATSSATGGNSPYTWVWSPSGGTNAGATGLAAGNYTCTVTDASGCTATQTVTITQAAPIFLTASSTQTACVTNTGTATGSASGGNPGYTYSWWNNGQTNAMATGLGAGTYTVQVTDANGCTQLQTVVVTTNNPVTVTTTSTQSSCLIDDGTATANPANGTSPYTYSWNDGQTTQTATGMGAGTYTVTVTDANGCSQTQTVVVPLQPGPTATAGANNTSISQGGSCQLNGGGGVTYSWYPATGLSCTTCQSPIATPNQTTTYCVQVTDANGCTDIACVTINVDIPCILGTLETLLPNAFSPNGDENNDEFCVPANACVVSFVLKIYDRWGEKVFETRDKEKCWDGIYRGMLLNTDVFAFYFDAELTNGSSFSKKGNISLVR